MHKSISIFLHVQKYKRNKQHKREYFGDAMYSRIFLPVRQLFQAFSESISKVQ